MILTITVKITIKIEIKINKKLTKHKKERTYRMNVSYYHLWLSCNNSHPLKTFENYGKVSGETLYFTWHLKSSNHTIFVISISAGTRTKVTFSIILSSFFSSSFLSFSLLSPPLPSPPPHSSPLTPPSPLPHRAEAWLVLMISHAADASERELGGYRPGPGFHNTSASSYGKGDSGHSLMSLSSLHFSTTFSFLPFFHYLLFASNQL